MRRRASQHRQPMFPVAMVAILLVFPWGCGSRPTTDDASTGAAISVRDALLEQIEEVRQGRSTSIRLEEGAVDDDLALLAELQDLQGIVILGSTEISDTGLARLANLNRLKTLNLNRTTITDDGLSSLAGLTELELLRLGSSHVRGPGLKHLQGMGALRHLILQRAPLEDNGLLHLYSLNNLQSLYVEETRITPEGLSKLQQELPSLSHIHPHY